MRRVSLLGGIAFALVALTGCPPTYPNCKSDENCQERGEVCVQGQCQECATDANCKPGFACQGNKCVPKGPTAECQDDAACGAGRICEAGRCTEAQCQEDAQCRGGGKCQQGRCVVAENRCTTDRDCASGQQCRGGQCVEATCDLSPVRFGFNESSLTSEAQSRLREIAECLKNTEGTVTLEGHADERGTEEYNLQLSNRRAAAVKKYLTDLGVRASRLETVGFGENRPLETGSDEEAWAANRRVEFQR